MFRQATDRFTEIVQGMKQMTADMQHELEVTRGELRRGVMELPQETADSAAQMRRVIVEQIEALAELNRIVARHGRGLDAVEPVGVPRRTRRLRAPADAPRCLPPPPRRAAPAPSQRSDITDVAPQPEISARSPGRCRRAVRKRPPPMPAKATAAADGSAICYTAPRATNPKAKRRARRPPPHAGSGRRRPHARRHTIESLEFPVRRYRAHDRP